MAECALTGSAPCFQAENELIVEMEMLSEILRFVEMKDDPVGVRSPGGQVRKGIDDMSARVFWGGERGGWGGKD